MSRTRSILSQHNSYNCGSKGLILSEAMKILLATSNKNALSRPQLYKIEVVLQINI